ncbi:unnamed protein product [Pleuronectes platessa]|uniref:Uncharacterized protein n=1 Tax=Pleuronectes platessa TaxID=8262 RepID=A0A9N7YKR4_PLEPL|nr:unnamed protein product [Pleuronectes platessa]
MGASCYLRLGTALTPRFGIASASGVNPASDSALSLLSSYLNDRTYRVTWRGSVSKPCPLTTGLPQDSWVPFSSLWKDSPTHDLTITFDGSVLDPNQTARILDTAVTIYQVSDKEAVISRICPYKGREHSNPTYQGGEIEAGTQLAEVGLDVDQQSDDWVFILMVGVL